MNANLPPLLSLKTTSPFAVFFIPTYVCSTRTYGGIVTTMAYVTTQCFIPWERTQEFASLAS